MVTDGGCRSCSVVMKIGTVACDGRSFGYNLLSGIKN